MFTLVSRETPAPSPAFCCLIHTYSTHYSHIRICAGRNQPRAPPAPGGQRGSLLLPRQSGPGGSDMGSSNNTSPCCYCFGGGGSSGKAGRRYLRRSSTVAANAASCACCHCHAAPPPVHRIPLWMRLLQVHCRSGGWRRWYRRCGRSGRGGCGWEGVHARSVASGRHTPVRLRNKCGGRYGPFVRLYPYSGPRSEIPPPYPPPPLITVILSPCSPSGSFCQGPM